MVEFTLKNFYFHLETSHNVTVEEDPGYLLLGDLITTFAQVLKMEFKSNFRYHAQRKVCMNQNKGRNPSTDGAIILRLVQAAPIKFLSKVLYEYKPVINQNILAVNPAFLIELFLQTFYVMKYENTSEVIGCLTDLRTWHYFKLISIHSQYITISWYHKVELNYETKINVSSQLQYHLSFLLHHLQPVTP